MRRTAILSLAAATILALPGAAAAATPKKVLLSLGDSLAQGWQPSANGGSAGPTTRGYVDRLATANGLRAIKYGCPGATTSSMIRGGGPCAGVKTKYNGSSVKSSQLARAEKYLRANRGKVAFVTVSIGGNDVQTCAKGGTVDVACVSSGIARIRKNVPTIAKRLRKAAGPTTKIAIQNQYDPFLANYLKGDDASKVIAEASVNLAKQVNAAISSGAKPSKLRVADAFDAFGTATPFTQTVDTPMGTIPVAVANICANTWMCTKQDIHANDAGYGLLAGAFAKALGVRS